MKNQFKNEQHNFRN